MVNVASFKCYFLFIPVNSVIQCVFSSFLTILYFKTIICKGEAEVFLGDQRSDVQSEYNLKDKQLNIEGFGLFFQNKKEMRDGLIAFNDYCN